MKQEVCNIQGEARRLEGCKIEHQSGPAGACHSSSSWSKCTTCWSIVWQLQWIGREWQAMLYSKAQSRDRVDRQTLALSCAGGSLAPGRLGGWVHGQISWCVLARVRRSSSWSMRITCQSGVWQLPWTGREWQAMLCLRAQSLLRTWMQSRYVRRPEP